MTDQLAREVANALWRPLVRKAWKVNTSSRRLSDNGDTIPFASVCTASIPKARALSDTIGQGGDAIAAQAAGLHIVLFRHKYRTAIRSLGPEAYSEWKRAINPAYAPKEPYHRQTDGRGNTHLIRIYDDFLTDNTYRILTRIAQSVTAWSVDSDAPLDLIRDHEVADPRLLVK